MPKAEIHFVPDESILKAISKVIKSERNKQGLTQEALSDKADLTLRHVQRFETNQLNPSLCSFIKIAKGLDIPADELLRNVMFEIQS